MKTFSNSSNFTTLILLILISLSTKPPLSKILHHKVRIYMYCMYHFVGGSKKTIPRACGSQALGIHIRQLPHPHVTAITCSMIKYVSMSILGISSEDSITKFAQQYKLQNTLQFLSGGISVGDLPVQLPKVIL